MQSLLQKSNQFRVVVDGKKTDPLGEQSFEFLFYLSLTKKSEIIYNFDSEN